MDRYSPSEDELRGMLYDVLGEWRTDELSFIRRRLLDIEDKIVALENKRLEDKPDRAEMKAKLEKIAARMSERNDDRIKMIEAAYASMIDFVDRREREAI